MSCARGRVEFFQSAPEIPGPDDFPVECWLAHENGGDVDVADGCFCCCCYSRWHHGRQRLPHTQSTRDRTRQKVQRAVRRSKTGAIEKKFLIFASTASHLSLIFTHFPFTDFHSNCRVNSRKFYTFE